MVFEPFAVFRALDRCDNGFLSRRDFLNFLWRNNSDANEEDMIMMLSKVSDVNGKV